MLSVGPRSRRRWSRSFGALRPKLRYAAIEAAALAKQPARSDLRPSVRKFPPEHILVAVGGFDAIIRRAREAVDEAQIRVLRDGYAAGDHEDQVIALPDLQILDEMGWDI